MPLARTLKVLSFHLAFGLVLVAGAGLTYAGGLTLYDRYTATKMNLHNVAFLSRRGGNLVEYCRLTGGVTMYPNTTITSWTTWSF